MTRHSTTLLAAVAAGQVVGQLGWVDALFVPLVVLGPVVTGAVAAARRTPLALVAVLWSSAGLAMAWTDWLVNREDVVFHLVLALLMPLLAGLAYGAVRLSPGRLRRTG